MSLISIIQKNQCGKLSQKMGLKAPFLYKKINNYKYVIIYNMIIKRFNNYERVSYCL